MPIAKRCSRFLFLGCLLVLPSAAVFAQATFVRQGRLAAIIYYNWTALPGFETQAIFRCGELTDAGKLALSAM
jgi:hypothetical protein